MKLLPSPLRQHLPLQATPSCSHSLVLVCKKVVNKFNVCTGCGIDAIRDTEPQFHLDPMRCRCSQTLRSSSRHSLLPRCGAKNWAHICSCVQYGWVSPVMEADGSASTTASAKQYQRRKVVVHLRKRWCRCCSPEWRFG